MKAIRCPFCDANELVPVSGRTMKCEYCGSVFVLESDEIPCDVLKADFDSKSFRDRMMKYLSEYPTAPADIFDSEFEDVEIKLRPFKSVHYDPNLVYRRETLNPDSNAFVPYYTMRYIYEGKGYYLGAYGIGLTKSYGVPPDVTEKISKSVLRRIGNDRIGILALILGTRSLVFSFSLTSVFLGIVALALLAAGGIITYLFYRKYKAENLKELVKNSAERKKKYAEMFGKEQ